MVKSLSKLERLNEYQVIYILIDPGIPICLKLNPTEQLSPTHTSYIISVIQ